MTARRPSASTSASRSIRPLALFSSPESRLESLALDDDDDDNGTPTSERRQSVASSSAFTLDSSSSQSESRETCSAGADDTSPVVGPGRLIGRLYDKLGQKLENAINRLAADKGPDAIADRLDTVLKRLLHKEFRMGLPDLVSTSDPSLAAIEVLLGLDQSQRNSSRKGSNASRESDKRQLESNVVGLRVIEDCGALLRLAIKDVVHSNRVRALSRMCVLAINYPIARDCFIEHGAIQQIEALSTADVALPRDAPTQPSEAVREISILKDRCLTVLAGRADDTFLLWERFHLAGDDVEREKIPNMMLSYLRNKRLSFVAARLLASIMRRPESRTDLSQDFWNDYLGLLASEMENSSQNKPGFDFEAIDELLLASLNRVSHFLGQYSVSFSSDGSALMDLASKLQDKDEILYMLYPSASSFAGTVLLPVHNRQRIRRDTL